MSDYYYNDLNCFACGVEILKDDRDAVKTCLSKTEARQDGRVIKQRMLCHVCLSIAKNGSKSTKYKKRLPQAHRSDKGANKTIRLKAFHNV